MNERELMTPEGLAALKEEIKHLTKEERPRLSKIIGAARELGDLKENADYHAAREQQALVEKRVAVIEGKLKQAQVVDIAALPKGDKVIFGVTVTATNLENDEQMRYRIVGEEEANLADGKISYRSPVAQAMLGKAIGDTIVVEAPSGSASFMVDKIDFNS